MLISGYANAVRRKKKVEMKLKRVRAVPAEQLDEMGSSQLRGALAGPGSATRLDGRPGALLAGTRYALSSAEECRFGCSADDWPSPLTSVRARR